jgi:hypothetical protein
MTSLPPGIVLADTITKLPAQARGAVVVSGSHGGLYPGYLAAKAGVRAVVLNDAGVGLDGAGIASLAYLEALGIAAAVVSHETCRIGDTADMLFRGIVSHANAPAGRVGVAAGLACREAAERLTSADHILADPTPVSEGRGWLGQDGAKRRILLVDSAAMVEAGDAGHIVVTGSHGGLIGGDLAMALRTDAFAAVFNDAGIGIDRAGLTRLPALEARGIAAFTVAAASARIGDARSSYATGVISAANDTALRLGAALGAAAAPILDAWAAR